VNGPDDDRRRGVGGLQNRDAARRLSNGGRELTRHLRDEFAQAAGEVAKKTQARILAADSRHPGPLRSQIAATVTVRGRVTQSGASAEIKSDGEKMPDREWNLGAYANARSARWRRWRHPVYARSDQPRSEWTWVSQTWLTAEGWFDDTIKAHAQDFSDAVRVAVEETTAYLEGR
jgi:hypothetical protein